MVGDFVVCVDRIISSACFDSPVTSAGGDQTPTGGGGEQQEKNSCTKFGGGEKSNAKSKKKSKGLIECRICQEEGDESEMESPCACNGTLKKSFLNVEQHCAKCNTRVVLCNCSNSTSLYQFAHRKCIQRWCNKKGDITCEICNQVYGPNYSVPLTRANSDVMAIDISRQGWGARIDLHDSHFLAIAAAEQELLNAEYEDYAAAHNSGIACCRSVALILMLLLLVRHVLMVIRDAGMVQDVSDFFNLSLQSAGFLLPCYLIVRSCCILQSRRRR